MSGRFLSHISLIAVLAGPLVAAGEARQEVIGTRWLRFDGYGLGLYQNSQNYSVSGGARWEPRLVVLNNWQILSGGDFKIAKAKSGVFPILAANVGIQRYWSRLAFAAGGGMQAYLPGTRDYPVDRWYFPSFYAQLGLQFEDRRFWKFDRVFLRYQGVIIPGLYTHEMQIGFGVTL